MIAKRYGWLLCCVAVWLGGSGLSGCTVPAAAAALPQVAAAPPPAQEAPAAAAAGDAEPVPPVWLVLPFAVLLVLIATGPLFFPHHWHRHYGKYAVALGLGVAAYYVLVLGAPQPILHALAEYVSFIALVASLFIAASGIYVHVNARGTPLTNAGLLFAGAVISNLIATTGAAMLFIRPFMRLNAGRMRPYHVVFFIFIVANVGGALTPIGDPPLFLGFLRGVPFEWTITHLWYLWLPTVVALIAIFCVFDARNKHVGPAPEPGAPRVTVMGRKNFFWVGVVVASVFLDPNVMAWVPDLHAALHLPIGVREIVMLTVAVVAYRFADREVLARNEFNFEPIREVGWLFLGIFATMQPALQHIGLFARDNADALGVGTFYWATGALSGVLDNAPTYLNFVSAAMGKFGLDVNAVSDVVSFALPEAAHPDSWHYLQAISVAAVFFGAFTYIGNAPNFMVKAIAESNGVDTPSFGGYVLRYAIPILLPLFAVIYFLFFSGWIS